MESTIAAPKEVGLAVATRVAERVAATRTAGTIVQLGPVRWGWYGYPTSPRLHLLVVGIEHHGYRVWLESSEGGRRVFQPEGDVPPKILTPLRSWLGQDANRTWVERLWVEFLELKAWLRIDPQKDHVRVVAYPHQPTQIARHIYLPLNVKAGEVHLEDGMLVVEVGDGDKLRWDLSKVLWRG